MSRHRVTNNGRVQYRPGKGHGVNVIKDPFSPRAICPGCGRDYMNQRQAESCRTSHPPVIPGGEDMRRPDYVPQGAVYVPSEHAERRRVRNLRLSIAALFIGVALVVAAAIAGKALAGMSGPERDDNTVWVTPATYGTPEYRHG